MPKFLFFFDQTMMYLNYVAIILAIVYASFTQEWILLATAIIALIITITLRTIIARKALLRFGQDIASWKIIPYELRLAWTYLLAKIRYRKADKNDFISHKL